MQTINPATMPPGEGLEKRIKVLFQESQDNIHRRTDRLFAGLMIFQWLAAMAAAFWISPRTWIGTTSQIHWHVWAAIFLGGVITSLPVYLAWKQPGRTLTRHAIAAAQMIFSALLIDLTGGRIETHFHIFGSLAFLAFYRDWRVLITATVVVVVDHFWRGVYWPQSIFGILAPGPWRWLEHSGWVIFEDIFLFVSIRQSLDEMLEVATRRAKLEAVNVEIENRVTERTVELAYERELLRALLDSSPDPIYFKDAQSRFLKSGQAHAKLFRVQGADELVGKTDFDFFTDEHARLAFDDEQEIIRTGRPLISRVEKEVLKSGRESWSLTSKMPLRNKDGKIIGTFGISKDITDIKETEAKLEQLHKKMIDTSRRAGMAEVATGILHNVGNVLNSINVASSCVVDNLKKSKAADLSKVVAMFHEHESDLGAFFTNNPKGKQIPVYLAHLAEHLSTEQAVALEELAGLQKNIGHIKDIITMQQSFAKAPGITDKLSITDLVEDALKMNAGAFARHDIVLIKEFQKVPFVTVEKHKVLQILVNLLNNAKQSCDELNPPEKRLTLRVTNGNDRVRIAVTDNGMGVLPENLTRIFAHGFTTKKDGHGFGLHSGALAAKQMGGSLSVNSDGPGQGATFTLELPCQTGDPT
jgi:PAS domain S-box-containing protein